jgi:CheY-like chemotaxis protein
MMTYVLIVDDDPDAQEILADIAEAMGFNTQCAGDGQEALELILAEVPLLVMLDLMMPKLDGFGVLARLRASPATRDIPVIVVTAYGQVDLLRLPGVTDIVQKGTFTVESLSSLITDTLETKPSF